MKREEMKARVRKLVREMQEPRTMAGFRQMAGEMEGMPTSFGSALSAGKPVGERIAELPAGLRATVTAMVLGILDLIEQSVEEKGMSGAEAVAQGVGQGLKAKGLSLTGTIPQQVGEAALRAEIRQALLEEGFFDDVKGALAQQASKAFSAVSKRALKMAVKDLTGLELPDAKADAMGELIKHAAPILISGSEDQFRTLMQKLGATAFGKAGEKAAEKLGMTGEKEGEKK